MISDFQPEVLKLEENKTVEHETSTSSAASADSLEDLQAEMPWLKNIMGLRNDTIVFSKGIKKIKNDSFSVQ